QSVPKPVGEEHVVARVAAQRARRTEYLGERVDHRPTELTQQLERRLFDQPLLRILPWCHPTDPSTRESRSSDDTSICPVTSFGRSRSLRDARWRALNVSARMAFIDEVNTSSAWSPISFGGWRTVTLSRSFFPMALKIVPPPIESSSANVSLNWPKRRPW